jgi:undecaprenyl-diphosphatase
VTLLQAIVLALVQGVTEFLPISSTAHLVLTSYLLGWRDQGLAFDVAVNTATLLAVVAYFRRDLAGLAAGVRRGEGTVEGMPPRRLLAALAVGTVPVAVAGWALSDWFETAARDPQLIAVGSIVFALLLGAADLWGRRRRDLATLGLGDALVVGLAQALALVPGTSRAGITLTAALVLGFRRPEAARFSFLLAIPVGLLAAAWDGLKLLRGEIAAADLLPMAAAFAVAAVSAYLVIGWLLAWLQRHGVMPFVGYRVLLGLAILALAL